MLDEEDPLDDVLDPPEVLEPPEVLDPPEVLEPPEVLDPPEVLEPPEVLLVVLEVEEDPISAFPLPTVTIIGNPDHGRVAVYVFASLPEPSVNSKTISGG